jgi:hypothetical protein
MSEIFSLSLSLIFQEELMSSPVSSLVTPTGVAAPKSPTKATTVQQIELDQLLSIRLSLPQYFQKGFNTFTASFEFEDTEISQASRHDHSIGTFAIEHLNIMETDNETGEKYPSTRWVGWISFSQKELASWSTMKTEHLSRMPKESEADPKDLPEIFKTAISALKSGISTIASEILLPKTRPSEILIFISFLLKVAFIFIFKCKIFFELK